MERLRIERSGVCRMRCLRRRTRCHGSSFRSRTHFLENADDITSIASNPALSSRPAIGSIISVRMLDAQRLKWPSRRVVSTKEIALAEGIAVMESGAELRLQAPSIEVHVSANPVVRCRGVSLAGCVFGEKDVAGMESHARAVAETDVHATRKRNDP